MGVPTLVGGYLPWPGGTYLGWGGGYLPWPVGYLPWPEGIPILAGGYLPGPGYPPPGVDKQTNGNYYFPQSYGCGR